MTKKEKLHNAISAFIAIDAITWRRSEDSSSIEGSSQYEWIRQININDEVFSEVINKGENGCRSYQLLTSLRDRNNLGEKGVFEELCNLVINAGRSTRCFIDPAIWLLPKVILGDDDLRMIQNEVLKNSPDDIKIGVRTLLLSLYMLNNHEGSLEYGELFTYLSNDRVIQSIFQFENVLENDLSSKFAKLMRILGSRVQEGPMDVFSRTLDQITLTTTFGPYTRSVLRVLYLFSKYPTSPLVGIEKAMTYDAKDKLDHLPFLATAYSLVLSENWIPINWREEKQIDVVERFINNSNHTHVNLSFVRRSILSFFAYQNFWYVTKIRSLIELRYGALKLVSVVDLGSKRTHLRRYIFKDSAGFIHTIYGKPISTNQRYE